MDDVNKNNKRLIYDVFKENNIINDSISIPYTEFEKMFDNSQDRRLIYDILVDPTLSVIEDTNRYPFEQFEIDMTDEIDKQNSEPISEPINKSNKYGINENLVKKWDLTKKRFNGTITEEENQLLNSIENIDKSKALKLVDSITSDKSISNLPFRFYTEFNLGIAQSYPMLIEAIATTFDSFNMLLGSELADTTGTKNLHSIVDKIQSQINEIQPSRSNNKIIDWFDSVSQNLGTQFVFLTLAPAKPLMAAIYESGMEAGGVSMDLRQQEAPDIEDRITLESIPGEILKDENFNNLVKDIKKRNPDATDLQATSIAYSTLLEQRNTGKINKANPNLYINNNKADTERIIKFYEDFALNIPIILATNALGILNDNIKSTIGRIFVSGLNESIQELFQESLSAELTGQELTAWDYIKIATTSFAIASGTRFLDIKNEQQRTKILKKMSQYKKDMNEAINESIKTKEITPEEGSKAKSEINKLTLESYIEVANDIENNKNRIIFESIPEETLKDENFNNLVKNIKKVNPDVTDLQATLAAYSVLLEQRNTEKINVKNNLQVKLDALYDDNLDISNALSEEVKKYIEANKQFIEFQNQSKEKTIKEKKVDAHRKLYKANPNLYINNAVQKILEFEKYNKNIDYDEIDIENIDEEVYKKLGLNVPIDTESNINDTEQASDSENYELLFQDEIPQEFTENKNFTYPKWATSNHKRVMNEFMRLPLNIFNKDGTPKKSAPKYPFKVKSKNFNDVVALIKEINNKYGYGNYGDVVIWDRGLQAIVFSNNPKWKVENPIFIKNEQFTFFEEENKVESENIESKEKLTKEQKENIANLKKSDSRWNKFSDEDIQRFIDSKKMTISSVIESKEVLETEEEIAKWLEISSSQDNIKSNILFQESGNVVIDEESGRKPVENQSYKDWANNTIGRFSAYTNEVLRKNQVKDLNETVDSLIEGKILVASFAIEQFKNRQYKPFIDRLKNAGFKQVEGKEWLMTKNGVTPEQLYQEQIKARFKETETSNKLLQGTNSFEPIQSMPDSRKVSLNLSNDVNRVSFNNISELIAYFKKMNIVDNSIQPFAEFVFNQIKDVPIKFVGRDHLFNVGTQNSIKMGEHPGAYHDKTIYINKDLIEERGLNWVYNTLTHEGIHHITIEALNWENSKMFNREFYNEVEAIYDNMMNRLNEDENIEFMDRKSVKMELKRISYDKTLSGDALMNAKRKALQEFAAYIMSNTTSELHQWTKNNYIKPNTTFLKKFLNSVKELFSRIFNKLKLTTDPISFHEAMEFSFVKHFNYTTKYKDVLKEVNSSFSKEDTDFYELITDFNNKETNEVNIKNIISAISDTTDWYSYAKSLDYKQFSSAFKSNANFDNSLNSYWTKNKFHLNVDLEQFKENTIKKIYSLAQSLRKEKIYRLTLNYHYKKYEKIKRISEDLELLSDIYYDKNNNEKSSYRFDIKLHEKVPILNQIFNSQLELIYLDEVKKNTDGNIRWIKINSKHNGTEFHRRNSVYAQILKKHGIIFPGTFSDKNTVIAFKGELKNVDKIIELYIERMNLFASKMVEKGIWTEKLAEAYLKFPSDFKQNKESYVLRAVIEDLRLGATFDENGFNSISFDPDNIKNSDALNIFKRATDVSPLHSLIKDQELHSIIYSELKDNTGISLDENGKLTFNTAIISNINDKVLEVEFKGKKIEIPISRFLLNEFETENFDGVNVHIGGFAEVVRQLAGSYYNTPLKGKILNKYGENPYYDKGAYFYTDSPYLEKWMKENDIALLSFSSAIKVNQNEKVSNLLDEKPNVFNLSFDDYFSDYEKSQAKGDAKGIGQSLTTFYNAESNKAYSPKDDSVIEYIYNKLVNEFIDKMANLDAGEAINHIRELSLTGTNKQQAVVSKILIDFIDTKIDNKINQAIADEVTAYEIGNILLEPYIAETLKSYISKNINKVIDTRIDMSWMTLRPDFGWLEPSNIEAIWNNIKDEQVKDIKESMNKWLKRQYELEKIIKKTNNEDKLNILKEELKKINKEIAILENENNKLDENTWNELEKIIDIKTGRLKDGWMYVSKDINDVQRKNGQKNYKIKFEDNIISTIIPGTDIGSQFAPKVAAVLNKAEVGFATYNSEYLQTEQGRDFDIDQILLTPFTSKYFTEKTYAEYVKSINESIKNYQEVKLEVYSTVLNKKIKRKNLNTEKNINVKFMQKVFSKRELDEFKVNPFLHSLFILDYFDKNVGSIINDNKLFTLQAQIGFKMKLSILGKEYILDPQKGITKFSIIASRLLNDNVDKPTNTNTFYYSMNKVQKFSLIYGIDLAKDLRRKGIQYNDDPNLMDIKGRQVYDEIVKLEEINSYLFKNAIKLNSDYSVQDFSKKKDLNELLNMISKQRKINQRLKENKISQVTINDLNKSPILYLIEKFPLNVIPNLNISLKQYSLWQKNILKELLKNDLIYLMTFNEAIKNNQNFINDFLKFNNNKTIDTEVNKYLFYQFISTRYNGKTNNVHMLKAKLIALVNPFEQTYAKLDKFDLERYYGNVFLAANSYAYPKLMKLAMEKRSIHFKPDVKEARLLAPNGKYIIVSKHSNGGLQFTFAKNNKGETITVTANELLTSDKILYQKVKELLIGDGDKSLFADEQKYNRKLTDAKKFITGGNDTDAKNRFEINKLFSFRFNTDFNNRIRLAKELLDTELPLLKNSLDKKLLWNSLIGYSEGKIYIPLNLIPNTADKFNNENFRTQDKLLELAATVKDPSGREFLNSYIKAASKTFPGSNLNSSMQFKIAIENNGSLDDEVFFSDPEIPRGDLIDDGINFRNRIDDIMSLINSHPEENTIDKEGTLDITFDFLGKAETGSFFTNLTKLDVSNAIDTFATRIPYRKVSLMAIELGKYKEMLKSFAQMNARFDNIMNDKIKANISKIIANKGIKVDSGMIVSEVNKLAEEFPIEFTVKKTIGNEYILQVGEKEYNINEMLKVLKITDINEKAKYRAAIHIRILYDFWNPRIAKGIRDYLLIKLNNSPEGFIYKDRVETIIERWNDRLIKFNFRKGYYIPRMYTEEVRNKLVDIYAIYRYLQAEKKYNHKDAYKEAIRLRELLTNDLELKEKIKPYRITVDAYDGTVHSWDLKRNLPDWLVNNEYITDDLSIHEIHQMQFLSNAMNDINMVEGWLYDHKSAINNQNPIVKKQMMHWFNQILQGTYSKTRRIKFNKAGAGDLVTFYYIKKNRRIKFNKAKAGDFITFYYINQNNYEQRIRGVVNRKANDNTISLEINKDIYRAQLDKKIAFLKKMRDKISKTVDLEIIKAEGQIIELVKLYAIKYDSSKELNLEDAINMVLEGLKNIKENEHLWGIYNLSDIHIKQYAGNKAIQAKGVELNRRHVKSINTYTFKVGKPFGKDWELTNPATIEESIQDLHKLFSVIGLGTPGAAIKNSIEAYWRMGQAINRIWLNRIPKSLRPNRSKFRDAKEFYYKFKREVEKGDLREAFLNASEAIKLKDISNLSRTSDEGLNKEKVRDALAIKYLLANGLGKSRTEVGSAYISNQMNDKVGLLAMFQRTEMINRIGGAFLFAHKAIFLDELTNVSEIEQVIDKEVARANSEYGIAMRSFMESNALGKLIMLFKQFNSDQLNKTRRAFIKAKELGQIKPVFEDIFDRTLLETIDNVKYNFNATMKTTLTAEAMNGKIYTYRVNDSVDPLIPAKLYREFKQDVLIGSTLEFLYPGLRVGAPGNRLIALMLSMITNYIITGEEPDEWDIADWIFSILGFKFGLLGQAPLRFIWNLMQKDMPIEKIVPMNPINSRQSTLLFDLGMSIINSEENFKKRLSNSQYMMEELSRFTTSINFMPYKRRRQSHLKNEITTTLPIFRPFVLPFELIKEVTE